MFVFRSFTTWAGLPTFTGFFRWKFMERDDSKLPSKDILDQTLPIKKPQFNINAKFSATWLGHSTVYVRMGNTTFITDPGSLLCLLLLYPMFSMGIQSLSN